MLARAMMRDGRWEMAMARRHERGMGGAMMDGGANPPGEAQ
jgi:hypothetical protein